MYMDKFSTNYIVSSDKWNDGGDVRIIDDLVGTKNKNIFFNEIINFAKYLFF